MFLQMAPLQVKGGSMFHHRFLSFVSVRDRMKQVTCPTCHTVAIKKNHPTPRSIRTRKKNGDIFVQIPPKKMEGQLKFEE